MTPEGTHVARSVLPPAAVTLTAAAGVLHVSAAAAHLDVSTLLSLAFLVVAVAQLATVATARRWPTATTELLVFANLAAVGAWAVSRTIGLPLVGTGVERIGTADVATVALELAAVATVVLGSRLAAAAPGLASFAVVLSLAGVAIAAPATGHAHDDDGAHEAADLGGADAVPVVQLGPGDFDGDPDLGRTENAEAMRSLMTGAVRPVVVTSDGRLAGTAVDDPHGSDLADAIESRRRELAASSAGDGHGHPDGTAPHDD